MHVFTYSTTNHVDLLVTSSLKQRFSEHGSLYADLSCLDLNFAEILIIMPSDEMCSNSCRRM